MNKLLIATSTVVCILFLSCIALKTNAQEQPSTILGVGSKMPDMEFNTIVNYPGGKAKLSDFAGKPVILDLWHKTCNACIAGMPKMQELQKKFEGKIQIIALTFSTLEDYKALKKRSPILQDIDYLPLALGDTLIKKLFDYEGYPTHVWIDGDRIIRAITRSENATEKHLQQFINKQELDFTMKQSKSASIKSYMQDTISLFKGRSHEFRNIPYSSIFTNRLEGYKDTYIKFGPKSPGVRRMNQTFMMFVSNFWSVKNKPLFVFGSDDLKRRFLVPANDDDYDKWYQENMFCYELNLPEGNIYSRQKINEYAKQDLQRFFDVKIEEKKQMASCLILYRLDDTDRIKTKGISHKRGYDGGMTYGFDFKNVPIADIANQIESGLSWRAEPVKVLDETNYKLNVDIEFKTKLFHLNDVQEGLKKYGLGLKTEPRMVDCLVISKAE